jgi:SAM-dependent methyltransferase
MDEKNSYKDSKQYSAYCRNTDEKAKLHDYISKAFTINPNRILDLGCGNGVNTAFLADRFPNSFIDAIERSPAQISVAKSQNYRQNVTYINLPFEDFETKGKYDFVLTSHVLQYIDSGLEGFVKKSGSILEPNGELWFVQQTNQGMAQIINHQKPFLTNERFNDWKTFEDYLPAINIAFGEGFQTEASYLNSSIKAIDFVNPSEEDKLRLEFIFCLDEPFDKQSPEFKTHLSRLVLGQNGRISHPNGIIKVRRRK